jgi:hypothetical protein
VPNYRPKLRKPSCSSDGTKFLFIPYFSSTLRVSVHRTLPSEEKVPPAPQGATAISRSKMVAIRERRLPV